ncbi:MAG: hypothetical protein JWO31_4046 [Phycisphaerales bacterium]|nr:hypothetical protein [Phycisphaerales bacterium]
MAKGTPKRAAGKAGKAGKAGTGGSVKRGSSSAQKASAAARPPRTSFAWGKSGPFDSRAALLAHAEEDVRSRLLLPVDVTEGKDRYQMYIKVSRLNLELVDDRPARQKKPAGITLAAVKGGRKPKPLPPVRLSEVDDYFPDDQAAPAATPSPPDAQG